MHLGCQRETQRLQIGKETNNRSKGDENKSKGQTLYFLTTKLLFHISVLPLIKIDKDTVLGEGRYGIVYKGTLSGKQAAIKRIQLTHINENEEKALKKLNHPNVIELLHIESDNEFR